MNDIDDVPVLSFPQFTALHMAISMSSNDYLISFLGELDSKVADGWCPIAVSVLYDVLYLARPEEENEDE